jgi:elongation factor G
MPAYTTADIRNIAFVGHAGSGKTSLVEAILHEAGVIGHVGQVEKGTTVSDYTPEEKQHGHSLFTSVMHGDYHGKHINLVDTPGYPDFIGHAISGLSSVETAAVVISAAAGIEPLARRMMERAAQRKLCRMIVVNKIDHENIDLPKLLEQIQVAFGSECLPVNLPVESHTGVVDCFFNTEGDSELGPVADWHKKIIEQIVEVDEELLMAYLDTGEVSAEKLHDVFEKALREGHLVPIFFTSARRPEDAAKSVGIGEMLEKIVKLAPSPLEGNPRPFIKGEGDAAEAFFPEPDPKKHAVAHVFRVFNDRFGKLGIFRVHQGTMTKDSQLFINNAKKPFKVGHMFKLQGKDHFEITDVIPGDIAAVIKVDDVHLHAVLHDSHDEDHIHLKPILYPEPMQGLAVTSKKRGDEQKISDGLHRIVDEDPCFKWMRDPSTHETVIRGMGEMHLRIILEMLKSRYNVEVDTKPPKIAYRETIMAKADGHHRHKKQTGGAGQFGEVYLRVEPLERGAGFEFVNDVFGGTIPIQYIPAVEKGVRQVLTEGCVAGYPMQDIRVSVYDGKYHAVDSKEVAFVTAGKRAFMDAIQKAQPVLLEPIVITEITVPADKMGDINGDLSGKRGRILGTDMIPGDLMVIKAQVPLSEMMNYQSQLKSVTGGQGSFTMELSHYDPVPAMLQQQIVAQYKPRAEED